MGIAIKIDGTNFSDKNLGVVTIEEPTIDKYLQYIEGDGQAYIATKKEHNCYRRQTSDIAGDIPTDVPKIEVVCALPYASEDLATKSILGTNGNHSVQVYANLIDFLTLQGNGAVFINKKVEGKNFKNKFKITYGSVKSYIDDTEIADNTNMVRAYRINAYPEDLIYLFYCNIARQDYYAKIRIYSYKVYIGNTLVLDLRPFQKADGTVCMKDEITDEYYYNAGSGNFIAGPSL